MTRKSKKERERYQVERFRAVFAGFPEGEIVDGKDDGSEPDFFLVQDQRRVLGIEVTELYRTTPPDKQPAQAAESLRKQIVDRARLIFEQNGGPILDVAVHFSMNQQWHKRRVALLARKLAKIISDYHALVGPNERLQNPWNDPAYFPYEIDSIWFHRYPGLTRSHWSTPDADVVPPFSADEIQARIREKNSLLSSYRKKKPEAVWLLIVYGLSLSSMFDTAPKVFEQNYESQFDRIFLFDWFTQRSVELAIGELQLEQSGPQSGAA